MPPFDRFRTFFVAIVFCAVLLPGTPVVAETEQADDGTRLELTLIDWNVPPGTRIRATVRAELKVFMRQQQTGADGKTKLQVVSPLEEVAPETLVWDVVTAEGGRASKTVEFTFPVRLEGLVGGLAGEMFTLDFEVSDPGSKPGTWTVARTDETELGLPLQGERLADPTACIRFTKDATGYSVGIAYECTAESFTAVQAGAGPCPTCGADGGAGR